MFSAAIGKKKLPIFHLRGLPYSMAAFHIIFVVTFLSITRESWAGTSHVYMYPTWCGTTLEVTAAKVIWPATNYREETNLHGTGYDCTVVARAEYLNQTLNVYASLALSEPTTGAVTASPVAMTTISSENVTVTSQIANVTTNSTENVTSENPTTASSTATTGSDATSSVTTGNDTSSSVTTGSDATSSVTTGNDITNSCDTDYLAIYDGSSTSDTLIEKLCYGNTFLDSANQDSSGPYVTFRFVRSGSYVYNFTLWYTSFHTGSCDDTDTWLECASGRCIKFHLTCDSANNCGRGDDTDQSDNAPASCSDSDPVSSIPDYTPVWVSLGLLGGLLAALLLYWCCWRPGWGPWRLAVLRQLGCCRKNGPAGGKTAGEPQKKPGDDRYEEKSDYDDDEEGGLGADGPEPASGGLLACCGGSKPGGSGTTNRVGHAWQAEPARKAGKRGDGGSRSGERSDDTHGDDCYRMNDVYYGDVYDIDDYSGGHAREAR